MKRSTISCRWTKQHEYLEKLNMQAVLNASQQEEEFVKEFFITYDKVFLSTLLWKKPNCWESCVHV